MLSHLNPTAAALPRVVLLGANGFVAGALRAVLGEGGTRVLAIGKSDIDLVNTDSAARLAAVIGPQDAVVVTAALTPEKGRDMTTLIRNLRMAETVAAAIAANPCSHLVYFSSDAVYDSRYEVVSEATPTAPDDLYGTMHLARELALKDAAAQSGIPFCVLRPCAIYGAGDTHNSYGPNRFVRTALSDARIRLFGKGEETRDHVFIEDVVNVARLALARRSTGVLNIVGGQAITFCRLAAEIAELAGIAVAIESLPRSGRITHRSFDSTALAHTFPVHKPTPLATGLERTIATLRVSVTTSS